MCYSVYISTDSPEDLGKYNSGLVRFERLADSNDDPCTVLLEFAHKWYVGSKSGCSCSFRHLVSVELGFSAPVDWYAEEADDIEATKELYTALDTMLSSGYRADLIDAWYGTAPEDMVGIEVSFDEVSSEAFRMFENHKFRLKKTLRHSSR